MSVFLTLNALSQKHEIGAELCGESYVARIARINTDYDMECMQELEPRPSRPYRIGDTWVIRVTWDPQMDCNLVHVMPLEDYQRELEVLTGSVEQALFLLAQPTPKKEMP